MLSSIIFLGSCEEEGIVKIQKSSKDSNEGSSTDSNKGPIKISKLVDNLEVENLGVSEKSESEEPKLPEGGEYEVVGGGYAVAMGEVDGSKKMWLSEEVNPRVWTEIESVKIKNAHSRNLPVSLRKSFPSRLTKISSDGEELKVTDEDGDIWTSSDNGVNWGMEKFAGGDGTSGDPYQIASASHLWLVRNHLTSHFQLIKDLDLSVITEEEGFDPIARNPDNFTGTLDGNGKKIKNLRIVGLNRKYVGLIGRNRGVIKNIGIEGAFAKGNQAVGALVGVNGINGQILNSYATGVDVIGNIGIGGLVGYNANLIRNSYVTGEVNGLTSLIGGLAGMNLSGSQEGVKFAGVIENSYTKMEVEGPKWVGGLVGQNRGGRIIGKNYWVGSVAKGVGSGIGANVFEKTDADLKELDATETGWDATIWTFEAGQYPKLAWQE